MRESGSSKKRLMGKVYTASITVRNVPNGTYYFTVTARDKSMNESPHSDELEVKQEGASYDVPSSPTGLEAGVYLFEKGSDFEFEEGGDFEFE